MHGVADRARRIRGTTAAPARPRRRLAMREETRYNSAAASLSMRFCSRRPLSGPLARTHHLNTARMTRATKPRGPAKPGRIHRVLQAGDRADSAMARRRADEGGLYSSALPQGRLQEAIDTTRRTARRPELVHAQRACRAYAPIWRIPSSNRLASRPGRLIRILSETAPVPDQDRALATQESLNRIGGWDDSGNLPGRHPLQP